MSNNRGFPAYSGRVLYARPSKAQGAAAVPRILRTTCRPSQLIMTMPQPPTAIASTLPGESW